MQLITVTILRRSRCHATFTPHYNQTKTKIAALAMITQRRQMYASHVDLDLFTVFMCLFSSKKLSGKSSA